MFPKTFQEAGRAWSSMRDEIQAVMQKTHFPGIVIGAVYFGEHGIFGGNVSIYPSALAESKDEKAVLARRFLDAALLAFLESKCAELRRAGVKEYGPIFNEGVQVNRRGYDEQISFEE